MPVSKKPSILGVLCGNGLAVLRLSTRLRNDLSWARRVCVPWPSTPLLLGVIALCLLVAVDVSTTGMQATRRAVVVALVGMSAVLVVPSVASAWLIMLLSGFQAVLTTGMITTVTSPAQTFNASFVSAVPEDRARFDLLNVTDSVVAGGSSRTSEGAWDPTTTSPSSIWRRPSRCGTAHDAGRSRRRGEDHAAGGRHAGSGGIGRGGACRPAARCSRAERGTPDGRLGIEDPNAAEPGAVIADLPVHAVDGVTGSLATGGTVILSSTAADPPIPQSLPSAHVFPWLDTEQRRTAVRLPEELHFSPEWMLLPRAPDTVDIPESLAWGAGLLAVVGMGSALLYGLQTGAAGRRVLAGARAMGPRGHHGGRYSGSLRRARVARPARGERP